MNIFRVADVESVPDWLIATVPEDNNANIEDVESINIAKEVDDGVLAQECDRIEACATNGKLYHYNSTWDNSTVSHLREYAIACGMDIEKFRGFDPTKLVQSKSNDIVRTAHVSSTVSTASTLQDVMGDPFHISERSDMSHMEETKWQQVTKQASLSEPSMDTRNVIALRGSENYFLNSDVNPAINQNSITNPDAIRQLAESDVIDNGARLKQQQADKKAQKLAENKQWETDKIKEMPHLDIVSKGNVFPTETLNAQNGLSTPSSQMGVYAAFDPNSIPLKTAGEKLAEKNKEYKASIQRPKEQDDWQKPCRQSSRGISDLFGEELSKTLKRN